MSHCLSLGTHAVGKAHAPACTCTFDRDVPRESHPPPVSLPARRFASARPHSRTWRCDSTCACFVFVVQISDRTRSKARRLVDRDRCEVPRRHRWRRERCRWREGRGIDGRRRFVDRWGGWDPPRKDLEEVRVDPWRKEQGPFQRFLSPFRGSRFETEGVPLPKRSCSRGEGHVRESARPRRGTSGTFIPRPRRQARNLPSGRAVES